MNLYESSANTHGIPYRATTSCALRPRHRSSRRPVGRLVLAFVSQLARLAAVGQHGPHLARTRARGLENEMPPVGSPAGPFVAALVSRELHQTVARQVHN